MSTFTAQIILGLGILLFILGVVLGSGVVVAVGFVGLIGGGFVYSHNIATAIDKMREKK